MFEKKKPEAIHHLKIVRDDSPAFERWWEDVNSFRGSKIAKNAIQQLQKTLHPEYLKRATSLEKKINRAMEPLSMRELEGTFMHHWTRNHLEYAKKIVKNAPHARPLWECLTGKNDGFPGQMGGITTDFCYQSRELFPEYSQLNGSKQNQFLLNDTFFTELRNRYRRVLNLALAPDRIAYYHSLKAKYGIGGEFNPLIIASVGGGPGSLEMDIQQILREEHRLYSRIIIFDVKESHARIGGLFAMMRGGDVFWVIRQLGVDDLCSEYEKKRFIQIFKEPLIAVNRVGAKMDILPDLFDRFHLVIMSGLWENYHNDQLLNWLGFAKISMEFNARLIGTLKLQYFLNKRGKRQQLYVYPLYKHYGFNILKSTFRDLKFLEASVKLKTAMLEVDTIEDGPLFPALSLRINCPDPNIKNDYNSGYSTTL